MDLDNEELEATKRKEKSADEMFEELGYEIEKIGNGTEYFLDEKEIAILINPETLKPEIWVDDFHAIERNLYRTGKLYRWRDGIGKE